MLAVGQDASTSLLLSLVVGEGAARQEPAHAVELVAHAEQPCATQARAVGPLGGVRIRMHVDARGHVHGEVVLRAAKSPTAPMLAWYECARSSVEHVRLRPRSAGALDVELVWDDEAAEEHIPESALDAAWLAAHSGAEHPIASTANVTAPPGSQ